MKLFSSLILASAALLSAVASRSHLDITGDVAPRKSTGEPFSWPGDAAAFRLRRRAGLSNSQRLQRGLTPSRPRKLYQAKVDSGLAKRIADPVAQAQASGGINVYTFVACYNQIATGTGFVSYDLTYTDTRDLANQCAARQDAVNPNAPGSFPNFFIADRPTVNCYVSVSPFEDSQLACADDMSQGAIYTLSPP